MQIKEFICVMNKILTTCFFLTFFTTINLNAQDVQEKPEKIRYYSGFFSTNFEIGDKDVSATEVATHIEKYSPKAYYDFMRGSELAKQSNLWLIVGLGGCLVATTSLSNDNLDNAILGLTIGAAGFGISSFKGFKSIAKQKSGIDKYNQKFGYR